MDGGTRTYFKRSGKIVQSNLLKKKKLYVEGLVYFPKKGGEGRTEIYWFLIKFFAPSSNRQVFWYKGYSLVLGPPPRPEAWTGLVTGDRHCTGVFL